MKRQIYGQSSYAFVVVSTVAHNGSNILILNKIRNRWRSFILNITWLNILPIKIPTHYTNTTIKIRNNFLNSPSIIYNIKTRTSF